ncbi:MAG: hypothetical protein ACQEW8_04225 [Actinomycetota bacterium]
MILAGLVLLTVGAVDLVRQFVPRRWIGYLAVAVVVLALGSASAAVLPMLFALAAGALWVWSMPDHRDSRLTFWPAVALAVLSVLAVVLLGDRTDPGLVGRVWEISSPFGPIPFDLAILVVGIMAFLLESGNLIVRAALSGEHTWRPDDDPVESSDADPTADPPVPTAGSEVRPVGGGFKGGRLIGPLERVVVFLLTLTGAYTLLAAVLAAKGIVRFPEISKDGETGARAEYFLVGSLVSWVIALGAAFLVWWSVHT